MEGESNYYDVIIVGAGIAGCGLAYNLKRIGYRGSVLVIDKRGIGANAGYGYRNIEEDIIEKFNLRYKKKFKGLKLDLEGRDLVIHKKFYFIRYKDLCNSFLLKSSFTHKKEKAIDIKGDLLITEKNNYKFKYLIDCSGPSFFLRRFFGFPLPLKYFIGKLHHIKTDKKYNDEFFYFYSKPNGYVEDLYFIDGGVIQGDWFLTDDTDFSKIKEQKYDLLRRFKIDRKLISKEYEIVEPISPVYPISTKRFGFLGDSFGNANPSSGRGIPPILESSIILAKCIKEDNLINFQKLWKKKYMKRYQRYLTSKMHQEDRLVLINLLINNPKIMEDYMFNKKLKIPLKILLKIPLKVILKEIYYRLFLKIKYFIMERKINPRKY